MIDVLQSISLVLLSMSVLILWWVLGRSRPAKVTAPPDFERLARESLYPAEVWRRAWHALPTPDLWPTVLELVLKTDNNPVGAAQLLASAYRPSGGTR